jgi:hypothetical protein
LSIPLGKLGFYIPRTLSQALSQEDDRAVPFHISNGSGSTFRPSDQLGEPGRLTIPVPGVIYRIGRSVIKPGASRANSRSTSKKTSQHATPRNVSPPAGRPSHEKIDVEDPGTGVAPVQHEISGTPSPLSPLGRSIRFPDERESEVSEKQGGASGEALNV